MLKSKNKIFALLVFSPLLIGGIIFAQSSITIPQARLALLNERTGFANTVTGGANGFLCTVTNLQNSGTGSLRDCASRGNRWIVFNVSGKITTGGLEVAGNTTIDGRGADITIDGTLKLINSNIIVENIAINNFVGNEQEDAIEIHGTYPDQGPDNIWIDHVDFVRTPDELLVLWSHKTSTTAPRRVTVTWSHFQDHMSSSSTQGSTHGLLIGSEPKGTRSAPTKLTSAYNLFETGSRQPTIGDSSQAHLFNNLHYRYIYGVGTKRNAKMLIENEIFDARVTPSTHKAFAYGFDSDIGEQSLKETGLWLLNGATGQGINPENIFTVPYSYSLLPANQQLYDLILSKAGKLPANAYSENSSFVYIPPAINTLDTFTGGGLTSQSSSPITQTCDAQSDPLCIPLGYDNCNPFFDFECEAITCSAQPICASQVTSCNGTSVFQCEGSDNACGGSIIRATKRYSCENEYSASRIGDDLNGCAVWSCDLVNQKVSGPFYDFQSTYPSCGDYKRCSESGSTDAAGWSEAAACECSGSCYPAPDIKDVGDETLSPKNVFDGSDKVKLPVNLGWEDNAQTLVENTDSAYFCPIGSYKYEVAGNGETVTGIEDGDLESIVESCKLFLDEEYKWKVQACLDSNGEDCGAWSDEGNFQSSTAPELKLPFDIDFEGDESGVAPFPVTLEWCSDLKANSYKLNAYEVLSLDPLIKKQVLQTGTSGSTKYSDSSLLGGLNQLRKGATYAWEISSCQNSNLENCGILSQLWSLIPGGELSSTLLLEPPSGAFVNMEDTLRWRDVVFATHFLIDIKELPSSLFAQDSKYSFRSFWSNLSLNTQYTWRVASCGGPPTSRNIEDCKKEDGSIPWSEERTFITTGAPPTNLNAAPTENGKTSIPFTLNWSGKGAASYVYEVLHNGSIIAGGKTENSNIKIQYKDLPQGLVDKNTTYSWRVKTCANKEGTVCGGWATSSLTTSSLTPPTINSPKTNVAETLRTIHLAWNDIFGGNFYENELTYASLTSPLLETPETSSYCSGNIGSVVNETRSTASINKDLRCTGQYNVRVRACSDQECTLAGDWSSSVSFTVIEPPVPKGIYGLVPCGLGINNPTSPWDEREPCGFGHIVLLIRNLIDFALWKLAITIIVLMSIVTALTIFFSVGGKDLLAQIRSIWRAVGVGVLILLFAWTLLNLLLGLLGFNVGIFGNWYEITL